MEDVATTILDYYQELFSSSNPNTPGTTLASIQQSITANMNDQLASKFQEWEVQAVVKQMASLKSPRLDGMPPIFYQNCWQLIGYDVTQFVLLYPSIESYFHYFHP